MKSLGHKSFGLTVLMSYLSASVTELLPGSLYSRARVPCISSPVKVLQIQRQHLNMTEILLTGTLNHNKATLIVHA